ncbi:hypothetical protein SCAR479_02132 [Seiridium cardinale]|uniref:Uncharacterized protein n=1 Tax=Seiridium cardinale TaxID=138064 RepID=A0ABR2Y4X0_9PEZI
MGNTSSQIFPWIVLTDPSLRKRWDLAVAWRGNMRLFICWGPQFRRRLPAHGCLTRQDANLAYYLLRGLSTSNRPYAYITVISQILIYPPSSIKTLNTREWGCRGIYRGDFLKFVLIRGNHDEDYSQWETACHYTDE